jgi:hypothetical protein
MDEVDEEVAEMAQRAVDAMETLEREGPAKTPRRMLPM